MRDGLNRLIIGVGMMTNASLATAADKPAPLLGLADLAGRVQITEGVAAGSSGSILYPEQILAIDIADAAEAAPADPRVAAWSKIYRFVLIPLNIAIQADPAKAPRSVKVNVTFRGPAGLPRQPMIVDIFPQNAFKAAPFQGEASLGVGADFKFSGVAPANAEGSLKAALSYKYAPAFANVQSGYAASTGYWQFAASQSEQPVGGLPLKLTVGIPRQDQPKSVVLAIDVVASFGPAWWDDPVRAAVLAEVLLP
jgi:hypothetical protein